MEASDGITIALGATTTGFLVKEAVAWLRARNQKTQVANDPLNVNKLDKYVTRGEFNKAIERNDEEHRRMHDDAERAHENIFARLTKNDRDMGEIKGLLTGVANDLQLIKSKLFKTR